MKKSYIVIDEKVMTWTQEAEFARALHRSGIPFITEHTDMQNYYYYRTISTQSENFPINMSLTYIVREQDEETTRLIMGLMGIII